MITTINYSLLPNDELYTLTKRVMTACNGLNLTTASPLKPLTDAINAILGQFEIASARESKGAYTGLLSNRDDIRDEAFLAFRGYSEAWSHRAIEDKRDAALKILDVIRRHGWSASSMGDKAESAALDNMIAELRSKFTAEVTLISATEWLDEVDAAQQSFEAGVHESASNASSDSSTLTNTRPTLVKSMRNLLSMITLLEPSMPELSPIISTINGLIAQSLTSAKAAATRAANQKTAEAKKTEGQ